MSEVPGWSPYGARAGTRTTSNIWPGWGNIHPAAEFSGDAGGPFLIRRDAGHVGQHNMGNARLAGHAAGSCRGSVGDQLVVQELGREVVGLVVGKVHSFVDE